MPLKPWRTLNRRFLFSTPRIRIHSESVELPDGRVVADYEQYDMGDFALILAQTEEGSVICERQYKHGLRRVCLTLPGGQVHPDEPPLVAAQRELLEETGYRAENWRNLGAYCTHANQGGATVHYFHASGAKQVQAPDSGDLEDMIIETLPPQRFLEEIRSGGFPVVADLALVTLVLTLPDHPLMETGA